ncbi:MAG: acyl-CoA dehydrogenase family protein [Bacteroidia bacterium]|nr:acyl-CoA dehydrogenase family protein [Bacteroidia bacterium]
MQTTAKRPAIRGGEFLIRATAPEEVFIPESFSEEQRMMAEACQDFIDRQIRPNLETLENPESGLMPVMLEKAGEMGLLGVTVPEEFGGLGMSFNTSMLIADMLGPTGSFSTAFGAHTGIGTLPIQYYGSEDQKAKYLPLLASGEWKSCYCLTEPEAGSDANSGKTRARLNEAGTHYLITGQKMWISNAGFADLMIVFAKVDDDKNHSAFIVERSFGNITLGDEEKKMGIKGSSTRQVFFNETPVPVENMLSERGNGFKIAVNILNIGRIKLAAAVIGACKSVIGEGVRYAAERRQFGQPIASFGAIRHKMAEMSVRTWVTEAAVYRAGQNIEDKIQELAEGGLPKHTAVLKATEEFAIECAMMKVHSSEVLDYVVDEGVQIFGGMGFSEEAPMARAYRDARITRIYEGTNEINRMLLVGMVLKRALKGELNLMAPVMAVVQELAQPQGELQPLEGPLGMEHAVLAQLKKATLLVAGKAVQDLGARINDEQELLMELAEMMIEVYAAESALLRAEKLAAGGEEAGSAMAIARIYLADTVDRVYTSGKRAIAAFAKEQEHAMLMSGLRRLTRAPLVNTVALRRELADQLTGKLDYAF